MAETLNLSGVFDSKEHGLVERLTRLPHKILAHHDIEGLSELVLHELGHDSCFGLKRAMYLVDNPDFDHLVGVAGFCKSECELHKSDLWEDPQTFHKDMESARFHNDLKKLAKKSLKKQEIDLHDSHDIKDLGQSMGMEDPAFFSWNVRHGNHGLLIFEKDKEISPWHHGLLANIVSLLGLCRH